MTDIADLFAAPPAGPSQDVTYRQGRVVSWSVLTANNIVDVGGTLLSDLPILNTSEALLLSTGDVVSLLAIRSEGGAVTYGILGRMTIPGTDDAVSAMSALGQYIESAQVNTGDTITSTTFAAGPTPGPEVTVDVRASGRVLVLLSAALTCDTAASEVFMGFALSGATTRVADGTNAVSLGTGNSGIPGLFVTGRVGASVFLDPIAAGSTTFTAMYRKVVGAGSASVANRELTVMPL